MSIFPSSNLDSQGALESLKLLQGIGVNWVALVISWRQDSISTTNIYPPSGTPTDEQISRFVQNAKSLGIEVLFKPHVDPNDGMWRAWIGLHYTPEQWTEWFRSYTSFITRYAELSERIGVKIFSAGVEYIIPSMHEAEWKEIIRQIRLVFKGTVTYAANWGGLYDSIEGSEIDRLKWVDALDIIGIDAYYPLTNEKYPTLIEIENGWKSWLPRIQNISTYWKKSVIFTEIGYKNVDGGLIHPGWWNVTTPSNLTQQTDAYEITLRTFIPQPWWEGIFWWAWSTDPNWGGPTNIDYTPNGKPAENVLKKYYQAK